MMKSQKKKSGALSPDMQPLGAKVARIDLVSKEHYACAPTGGRSSTEVRHFGSTTPQLRLLVEWLKTCGVESAAMESTSVYWIPLYELFEEAKIKPVLVNARQLHKVPGRKTDVLDCLWIQKLHSCGLLRGSFRPQADICELRAVTRQCANLVEERSKAVAWMQKALDQMNVQVHRAVTDIAGATGLAIVRAIVAGERDPLKLATLRDRRCAKSVEHLSSTLSIFRRHRRASLRDGR